MRPASEASRSLALPVHSPAWAHYLSCHIFMSQLESFHAQPFPLAGGKYFLYGTRAEEVRGDREEVLAAVQQNGWVLQYASEELRGERECMLAAVQQNGWALQYASQAKKRHTATGSSLRAAIQRSQFRALQLSSAVHLC